MRKSVFGIAICDKKTFRTALTVTLAAILGIYLVTYPLATHLRTAYHTVESPITKDRNGNVIGIQPNKYGYYARKTEHIPEHIKALLIKKEDRFFYWHAGINPFSMLRGAISYLATGMFEGSSTLTQQLVKILLHNEGNRTFWNKLVEMVYATSLELHASKNEILAMYGDVAYFGNRAQGIEEASLFYFNKSSMLLHDNEILSLLAALNSPSTRYPGSFENKKILPYVASVLNITIDAALSNTIKGGNAAMRRKNNTSFEIDTMEVTCADHCELTIDSTLTETIRNILERNLRLPSFTHVDNGAVVIIKLPENELLSIIGSPDPESPVQGSQINMAIRARPIGSTAKPFIYLNAFEKGARPYSLVEDQEYAYQIGTGFAFYPKNYDGQYRGTVTLHQALSNSLNVPSVKVLEFVGLKKMYDFLKHSLGFKPIQPLENYELGIALGTLEMDLLTLSHYFTIFPNEGMLKPLKIKKGGSLATPMGPDMQEEKQVAKKELAQLINRILSDREAAVEQFGMKSNLTLNHNHYALKTGTSRDFHDSWTIGYTPDFLVGVWLGNSDNTPMRQISGQIGAGKVWHEVMEILLNSPYNKKTPFSFDSIKEFTESGAIEYGLAGDDYNTARTLLKEQQLIIHPHDKDVFVYDEKAIIHLRARKSVMWFINNVFLGTGDDISWNPRQSGLVTITARDKDEKEKNVTIRIMTED